MDSIPAVLDNVNGVDATSDISSHLNMVMTMMADLTNKVTILELAPQVAAVPASALGGAPLLEPETTTRQPGPSQTLEIEETTQVGGTAASPTTLASGQFISRGLLK